MSRCALSSDHYGGVEESVTGAREWALGTKVLVMRSRLVVFLISDNPCSQLRMLVEDVYGIFLCSGLS